MTSPEELRALLEKLQAVEHAPYIDGIATTCWQRNPDGPAAADAIEALVAERNGLREAAVGLLDNMASTYKARNGREVGIQGEDGEKCWIVHSDYIAALEAALDRARALVGRGEG